jgi:hypothetical protein
MNADRFLGCFLQKFGIDGGKKWALSIPAPPSSAGILDRSGKLKIFMSLAQTIFNWETMYAIVMV